MTAETQSWGDALRTAVRYSLTYLFVLMFVALILMALSSCSMLGIATEGYVNTRIDDVKSNVTDCATEVAKPVDAVVPGYAGFVRAAYMGKPVPPPPPPNEFPWVELLGSVAASLTLGVPAAVKVTNTIRDNNRMKRGEALTVDQAVAKGYFEDSAKAPTPGA